MKEISRNVGLDKKDPRIMKILQWRQTALVRLKEENTELKILRFVYVRTT